MGVEVVESNASLNVENGSDAKAPVENGKVSIMFGSHGGEEPKAEVNKVSESNLPKDAVDEWPEPKQIHSFYAVKIRPIEDQSVKAKLDVHDRDIQKINQARGQKIDQLRTKRGERSQVVGQLRTYGGEKKQINSKMDEKRKVMEPLTQALGTLRGGRDRNTGIFSSEAELNDYIKSLQYRIQHESIPLTEEKQILREIKQVEATRSQVIANAAQRAKIQESMGEQGAIQDQVKLLGGSLDGDRKERQDIYSKIKELEDIKAAIDKEIAAVEDELTALTEKRDKKFEQIKELRKQREEGNSPFYENRKILSSAKELAAKKDVAALKELVDSEVEKFMALWNSKKAFREDYEKRILSSLDMRQLSKDGRQRNPNEKPLMQVDAPTPSQPEAVKPSSKPAAKEINVSPPQAEATAEKTQNVKAVKSNKEGNKKSEINKTDVEEEVFTLNTLPSNPVTKIDKVVDEKKLKELKREEEIAKRNLAEERKKKLAEKAAAKAAIKAQKEAEKKLKEREKRARKKSGAPAEAEEPTEAVEEVAEEEKMEEKIETPAPQKTKERKETNIRSRTRARGPESLPKTILKRKKATNHWLYAGSAAAVVLLVLITVGYSYLA